MSRIQSRLRQARSECGLSLKRLAKKPGMPSESSLSRYECGQRDINLDTLEKLANATNKDVRWFIDCPDNAGPKHFPTWKRISRLVTHLTSAELHDIEHFLFYTLYKKFETQRSTHIPARRLKKSKLNVSSTLQLGEQQELH